MNKTIFLIRHAESMANAGFATIDAKSVPLSEKGFTQAEQLKTGFAFDPELIVFSPYLRTKQTAEPFISEHLQSKVEEWSTVHEFTYLDRDKHANTTSTERAVYAVDYWNKNDPLYRDGKHEENFFELLQRAEDTIQEIKNRTEENIAIFTHGQFILALSLVKRINKKVSNLEIEELKSLMVEIQNLFRTRHPKNAEPILWEDL